MEGHSDLTRTTLAVLFVGGMIAACFWILRPFLPAIIWATTLVVATWPIMLRVQRRLWNRRALAVAVMTLALLFVFVVPFWLAITTIADNFDRIVEWGNSLAAFKLPAPPKWLSGVPFFGERTALFWENIATSGIDPLVAKAAPYAGGVASWFVAVLGGLGIVLVQFLLTIAVAAIMYANGEYAAIAARRFGPARGSGDPECGIGCRGNCACPIGPRRRWNSARRHAACGSTDRRNVHAVYCATGPLADTGAGRDLALLERRFGMGNLSPGLECLAEHLRQRVASVTDP
jgi:hypothetical protein